MKTYCQMPSPRQLKGKRIPGLATRAGLLIPLIAISSVLGAPARALGWLAPSEMAVGCRNDVLYVAGERLGMILAVKVPGGDVGNRIEIGEPITGLACVGPSGRLVITTGGSGSSISLWDPTDLRLLRRWPARPGACSPVSDPERGLLYIPNRFDSSVSVYRLESREEVGRIPVLREPVAAALSSDGTRLFVANLLPEGPANADRVAAAVTVINTESLTVGTHIRLPEGSTGLRGIAVSPAGRWCAVVHTLARFRVPTTQVEHGWMNVAAISLIDTETATLAATVLLDEPRRGAADPWGVVWTPDGGTLCITHAGTHEVSLVSMAGLEDRLKSHPSGRLIGNWRVLEGIRRRIALSGHGPRSMVISEGLLYAAEFFSDSISVVDPTEGQVTKRWILGKGSEASLEGEGERWFHDATLARQGWQSCATCHPDGRADGLNWDLLNDGIGNPKNTKSLVWCDRTPPVMASGVRATASEAVRSGLRHILFRAPPEDVASAIDRYLESLEPRRSPLLVEGQLSGAAKRGRLLFENPAIGCARCHPAPMYTDLQLHAVGTRNKTDKAEDRFDTPTLVECWRTGPYLHDGSAATVLEVLTTHNPRDEHGVTSELSPAQVNDLATFVLSL